MITITAGAEKALGSGISKEELEGGVSYRFSEEGTGGVTLTKGKYEQGDAEFDYQGETVLRIPPAIADRLGEVMVDVAPTPDGTLTLVLKSPE